MGVNDAKYRENWACAQEIHWVNQENDLIEVEFSFKKGDFDPVGRGRRHNPYFL